MFFKSICGFETVIVCCFKQSDAREFCFYYLYLLVIRKPLKYNNHSNKLIAFLCRKKSRSDGRQIEIKTIRSALDLSNVN